MYIVIYRPHGKLNFETTYFGPFETHVDAYNFLEKLPALGANIESISGLSNGVKFIQKLDY